MIHSNLSIVHRSAWMSIVHDDITKWKHFLATGLLYEEFTGHRWILSQRPVTRSFDVFLELFLDKRLSKQSWGWWFETQSRTLWRHCNGWHSYAARRHISYPSGSLITIKLALRSGLVYHRNWNGCQHTLKGFTWWAKRYQLAFAEVAWDFVYINRLRPRQNGRHIPDDLFKRNFLNKMLWI